MKSVLIAPETKPEIKYPCLFKFIYNLGKDWSFVVLAVDEFTGTVVYSERNISPFHPVGRRFTVCKTFLNHKWELFDGKIELSNQ